MMRKLGIVAGLVIMFASVTAAQTLIFSDDFNDGVADGWTVVRGVWEVESGKYTGVYNQRLPFGVTKSSTTPSGDAIVEVKIRIISGDDNGFFPRYVDDNNFILFRWSAYNTVVLYEYVGGTLTKDQYSARSYDPSQWHTFKVRLEDNRAYGYIDDIQVVSIPTHITSGYLALGIGKGNEDSAYAHFDDVKVYSLAPTCTETYLSEYQCIGTTKQQKYQYTDCTTTWKNVEYNSAYCGYVPPTPTPLICDSTALAIVKAVGGCSAVDRTKYANVYNACCSITKDYLLSLLNDALADGKITGDEKKSLLDALNTYLAVGSI